MLRVNCEAVMWKITTRGFTLEEVVIMAVMNLLTSVDRLPNARTGVAEMKRRSRMDLNSIKRTILAAVCVLALSSVNAVAQEIRSEISLQGTGVLHKRRRRKWDSATRDRHRWISGWLSLQLQSLACSRGELRI